MPAPTSRRIEVIGLSGIPEIRAGDDLAALALDACERDGAALLDGDVFVFTQKVVSKSEGRIVSLATIEPSALASRFGQRLGTGPAARGAGSPGGAARRSHGPGCPRYRDPSRSRMRQLRRRCLQYRGGGLGMSSSRGSRSLRGGAKVRSRGAHGEAARGHRDRYLRPAMARRTSERRDRYRRHGSDRRFSRPPRFSGTKAPGERDRCRGRDRRRRGAGHGETRPRARRPGPRILVRARRGRHAAAHSRPGAGFCFDEQNRDSRRNGKGRPGPRAALRRARALRHPRLAGKRERGSRSPKS